MSSAVSVAGAGCRVVMRAHGRPEVLTLEPADLPAPGPREVRVRVRAAGVNFFDTQLRSGLYKRPLPMTPGTEGAGVVERIGAEVTECAAGDRVAWILSPGSYATHANISIDRIMPLPDAVDEETAAATLYQALTAHYLARSTYELKPGDVCVVHSAAGGVGGLLCQIAKIAGAVVLGTVSSSAKLHAARRAGADHVSIYTEEDFSERAHAITGGRGVDVVYDAVGLETYERSLKALRRRGVLALYGEASGIVPPIDVRILLQAGSVYLTRTGLDSYIVTRQDLMERAAEIFAWMAQGRLAQVIGHRFPLEQVAAAHHTLEARSNVGKVLLLP